jgi:acyl transferase domain-containing protein
MTQEVILASQKQQGVALSRTLLAQPSLFALEYALTRVWAMMGVEPSVVMGHSTGEVVAAVVAGCMSLHDGAKLICARAKAMDALPGMCPPVPPFACLFIPLSLSSKHRRVSVRTPACRQSYVAYFCRW